MAKSFEFYAGETRTLNIRLVKVELDGNTRPWTIPAASTVNVILPTSGELADLTIAASVDNYDLGEISVALTSTHTDALVSGDIIVEVTTAGKVRNTRLKNALIRNIL